MIVRGMLHDAEGNWLKGTMLITTYLRPDCCTEHLASASSSGSNHDRAFISAPCFGSVLMWSSTFARYIIICLAFFYTHDRESHPRPGSTLSETSI